MDTMQSAPLFASADAKAFGAYYTDVEIADFLAWWAIRAADATVLDPCFGGGVFLQSACRRLNELGGRASAQVFGAELDGAAYRDTAQSLMKQHGIVGRNLRREDFFELTQWPLETVDAVIGNPPFIRYQRFTGDTRRAALARCSDSGVVLPELCSAWAPFLVHCISKLRTGGRLAMVIPMEIGHAKYAQPVLQHLYRSFETVTFLTFRQKLFPDLSEDTLLLLAENSGGAPARFLLRDYSKASSLSEVRLDAMPLSDAQEIDSQMISEASSRLVEYLIPERARSLYRHLIDSNLAQRLGELANVGIGYVTGANEFFHLSPEVARDRQIPRSLLKPAVKRGRALRGLRFTKEDWKLAAKDGDAGYLLHIPKDALPTDSVEKYIRGGAAEGIDQKYKCRTRSPWFSVPHVHQGDAFLTYMSGLTPRLVANHARVVAPNTLHIVRIDPLNSIRADALVAMWQTSLTRLSVEIEGHALGGGMLKLEPTEAKRVVLPTCTTNAVSRLEELAGELDGLMREGNEDGVRLRADQVILQGFLGLSAHDCDLLWQAAKVLGGRRGYGISTNGTG
jgi:adenine-specific DNA methylase